MGQTDDFLWLICHLLVGADSHPLPSVLRERAYYFLGGNPRVTETRGHGWHKQFEILKWVGTVQIWTQRMTSWHGWAPISPGFCAGLWPTPHPPPLDPGEWAGAIALDLQVPPGPDSRCCCADNRPHPASPLPSPRQWSQPGRPQLCVYKGTQGTSTVRPALSAFSSSTASNTHHHHHVSDEEWESYHHVHVGQDGFAGWGHRHRDSGEVSPAWVTKWEGRDQ